MRILQAFDFLSLPHGGGTVDIVCELSKALSAREHDIAVRYTPEKQERRGLK